MSPRPVGSSWHRLCHPALRGEGKPRGVAGRQPCGACCWPRRGRIPFASPLAESTAMKRCRFLFALAVLLAAASAAFAAPKYEITVAAGKGDRVAGPVHVVLPADEVGNANPVLADAA